MLSCFPLIVIFCFARNLQLPSIFRKQALLSLFLFRVLLTEIFTNILQYFWKCKRSLYCFFITFAVGILWLSSNYRIQNCLLLIMTGQHTTLISFYTTETKFGIWGHIIVEPFPFLITRFLEWSFLTPKTWYRKFEMCVLKMWLDYIRCRPLL